MVLIQIFVFQLLSNYVRFSVSTACEVARLNERAGSARLLPLVVADWLGELIGIRRRLVMLSVCRVDVPLKAESINSLEVTFMGFFVGLDIQPNLFFIAAYLVDLL